MSLQGSGGIDTEWTRRVGPKVLSDMYCFAYKASKTMGFLAGLYSRLRVIGVDGMNTPTNQKGFNNFTGQKGDLPVSPAIATCASPTPESFQEHVYGEGNTIENRLFDMHRDEDPQTGRNAVKGIEYKQPFADETDGHSVRRWRHMNLTPVVSFAHDPDPAWLDSLRQRGITATPPRKRDDQSVRSRKDYKFQVPSEQWESFKGDVLQNQKGHIFDLTGDQKNFVDLIEHRRKNGQDISQDLDMPYYETIPLKGSQLLVYDDVGLPMSLNVNYKSKSGSLVQADYVVRDPEGLVDKYANPELGRLVAARDAALENAKPNTPNQQQHLAEAQQAQQQILAMVQQNKLAPAQAGAFKQAIQAGDENLKKLCLDGFRELAAHGGVQIAHTDVAHSETCAPALGNVETIVPHVDSALLPINYDNTLTSPQDVRNGGMKKVRLPYCPPYTVKARKQQMGDQVHHAARWFEPGKGWVFGPLPDGVEPVQSFDGTRVVVGNTSMYRGKPDGTVHKIDNGQWTRHNPNSKGSFIPGKLTDVMLAPEYASSKGTDKHLVNRMGHDRNGWVIHFQEHPLKEAGGEITTSRQQSSKPFFPGEDLKSSMIEVDGQPRMLSEFAFQQGGKVYFKDNGAAYEFMKSKLNFKDHDIGPFTRMTDQDLRIVDDIAADSIAYYNEIEKTPPEQRQGMQIDQEKYDHGRVCSNCGGHTPPPEVMHALAGAIENPHEALQPKSGTLWAIKSRTASGEQWITDNNGEIVMFGAQSQAQKALSLPDIKGRAEGGELVVSDFPGNGQKTLMVPSLTARRKSDPNAELVPGSAHMAEAIINYNQLVLAAPDQQQEQPDEKDADFAQHGEQAMAPTLPGPNPGQQGPEQPPQPVATAPAQPQPIPQQPPEVAEQPLLQPVQQPKPEPARIAAIQRLVKLANWLDDNDRHDEASRVDEILREVSGE
jgi:hypothetical protein